MGRNESLVVVVEDHDVIADWRRAFKNRVDVERFEDGVYALVVRPGRALELVG